MSSFSCSFSWDGLREVLPLLQAIGTGLWDSATEGQNFASALDVTADDAEGLYRGYLQGHPIPGRGALKNPSGALAKSVTRRAEGWMRYLGNSSDHAKAVEDGAPARDMKKSLATSKKARRAKDGSLYLIIPFRHFTPSDQRPSMPKEIYALANALSRSYQRGQDGYRLSATGHFVPRWRYQWGGSLPSKKALQAAGFSAAVASRYAGLYKFGEPRHTNYITFRVMSEKSTGWIRPAMEGKKPLETALKVATERNLGNLARAFEADIPAIVERAMLGGS